MLPNDAPWCGLEAYGRGDYDKLFLIKMGTNLESTMHGQGHIFTLDLICSQSMCHAERSYIQ